MDEEQSIADWRVRDLMAAIGSGQVAPGAGSAGAVTLALAAACAGKAAVISLKHRPTEPALQGAPEACTEIARLALTDADRDSEAFAQFIRTHNAASAARLIDAGEALAALRSALLGVVERVERHVERSVAGDLVAARALAEAAGIIQAHNEAETEGK